MPLISSVFFLGRETENCPRNHYFGTFSCFSTGRNIFLAHFFPNFLGQSEVFSGKISDFFSGSILFFSGRNSGIVYILTGKMLHFFLGNSLFFFSGTILYFFLGIIFVISCSFWKLFSASFKISRAEKLNFFSGRIFFSREKKNTAYSIYYAVTTF